MDKKKINEDFLIMWMKNALEDIKYTKTRLWLTAYYVLGLFSIIVSFCLIINPDTCFEKLIIMFLTILIASITTRMIVGLQKDLKKYRGTIEEFKKEYANEKIKKIMRDTPLGYVSMFYFSVYFISFIAISWLGVGVIFWLLFNNVILLTLIAILSMIFLIIFL